MTIEELVLENDRLKKDVEILQRYFDGALDMYLGYLWYSKYLEDVIMRIEKGLPRLIKDEFKKIWPVQSSKMDEVKAEFISRKISELKQP